MSAQRDGIMSKLPTLHTAIWLWKYNIIETNDPMIQPLYGAVE